MTDYNDLMLRYTDGEKTALLVFDQGTQTLQIDVLPTARSIATAAQLVEALATGGTYRVVNGIYTGNFVAKADGVRLLCEPDVVLTPKEPSVATLVVFGSGFSMRGGLIQGSDKTDTVICGSFNATTAEAQPTDVLFEDVEILAPPTGGKRGIAVHTRAFTMRHCRIAGYYRNGQEVQAIWIHNGPGPYTIEDCYLEGAGENLLTGGATVKIPNCVPSDIVIRHCTFYKPDKWRPGGTQPATVKNILELKNAQRVLVEYCVLDGCWKSGQAGSAIVFTVRNTAATEGGNNPWVIVDQIMFRHNIVRRAPQGYAVNILGHDDGGRASEQTKRIEIIDNLFEDATGIVQISNGVTDMLKLERNTFPCPNGAIIMFANWKGTKTHLEVLDNCGLTGIYTVFTSGGTGGGPIGAMTDGCGANNFLFTENVLERSVYKNSAGQPTIAKPVLPPGNTLLAPNAIVWGETYVYTGEGSPAGWPGPEGLPPIPDGAVVVNQTRIEIDENTVSMDPIEIDNAASIEV